MRDLFFLFNDCGWVIVSIENLTSFWIYDLRNKQKKEGEKKVYFDFSRPLEPHLRHKSCFSRMVFKWTHPSVRLWKGGGGCECVCVFLWFLVRHISHQHQMITDGLISCWLFDSLRRLMFLHSVTFAVDLSITGVVSAWEHLQEHESLLCVFPSIWWTVRPRDWALTLCLCLFLTGDNIKNEEMKGKVFHFVPRIHTKTQQRGFWHLFVCLFHLWPISL